MPSVSTSLVLARPGTPTRRPWPPARSVMRVRSTTCSWPKMTVWMASRARPMVSSVASALRTMASSRGGGRLSDAGRHEVLLHALCQPLPSVCRQTGTCKRVDPPQSGPERIGRHNRCVYGVERVTARSSASIQLSPFFLHACVMIDSHPDPSAVPVLNQELSRLVSSLGPSARNLPPVERWNPDLLRRDRHAHRRATGPGTTTARRSAGRRWSSCSPRCCARIPSGTCSSRPWSGSASRSRTRPFSPSRWRWTGRGDGGRSPSGPMWTTSCGSAPTIPCASSATATGGVKPYVRVRGGPVGAGDAGARPRSRRARRGARRSTATRSFGIAAGGAVLSDRAAHPSSKRPHDGATRSPRRTSLSARRRRLRPEPPRPPRCPRQSARATIRLQDEPFVAPARRSRPPSWCRSSCTTHEPARALHRARAGLREHSGQIAFPGGRIDPDDASPLEAALTGRPRRRSGSTARLVAPLGYLDAYLSARTTSSCRWSASSRPPSRSDLNPHEVADTFEVPLGFLMDPEQARAARPGVEGPAAPLLCNALWRALHLGRHGRHHPQPVRKTLRSMIRVIRREVLLFLLPFAAFALYLVVRRRNPCRGPPGATRRFWLVIAGLGLRDRGAARHRRPRRAADGPSCRRMWRTAAWCPDSSGDRSSPTGRSRRPPARAGRCGACSTRWTATARRRGSSAARCATRSSAARSPRSTARRPRRPRVVDATGASEAGLQGRSRPGSSTAR